MTPESDNVLTRINGVIPVGVVFILPEPLAISVATTTCPLTVDIATTLNTLSWTPALSNPTSRFDSM